MTTVFEDDFEAYDNNTEVAAGGWAAVVLPGLVDTNSQIGDQSIAHYGIDASNQRMTRALASGLDSSTEPIRASYWLYDGNGAGFNTDDHPSYTAGLNGRTGLHFGINNTNYMYVGAYHTNPGTPTHYAVRVMGGSSTNWSNTTLPRTVGWQKFTIVMDDGDISFYHNEDETPFFTDTYTTLSGWGEWIALGSPAGGPYNHAHYDGLLIQTGTPLAATPTPTPTP
ncbi:MAG: hypothetical protein JJU11_05025, partial [Candidatus Sumerlaeia bacterium]|nr:hypothetical protein [Candidatus Sumerlaeia bacterium]